MAEKDMDIDLDRFFDHYYSTGWCDKKGRRLDGWHFALSRLANHGEWLYIYILLSFFEKQCYKTAINRKDQK